MSGRQAIAGVVVASLLVSACGSGADDARPGADGLSRAPNVVVVMTDDQDAASLRRMPAVRRLLADRGATFTRSFATTPECCPSRATYLTGQYAHNHGVLSSDPPRGGYSALDHANTLPVWVRRAGYRTAHFGKYLNGYGNPADGNDPLEVPAGWDEWHAPVNHTEYLMYGYELNENGRIHGYGASPRDYLTDVLARKATRYVAAAAGRSRPFFLSVAPLAPHGEGIAEDDPGATRDPRPAPRHVGAFEQLPAPSGPAHQETDLSDKPGIVQARAAKAAPRIAAGELLVEQRGRLESLLAVDELVGDLVAELRRSGELARTYFLFTSDNGYLLGEHGLLGKDLPYEQSARVPLVMRGPGIPAGVRRGQLTANIDLAPTIAAITGAEPSLEADGISLLPLARDRRAGPNRDLVIELPSGKKSYVAIRTADDRMLAEYEGGEVEMYDLRQDPHQLQSLDAGAAAADVRARLQRRLEALRDCAGAGCR